MKREIWLSVYHQTDYSKNDEIEHLQACHLISFSLPIDLECLNLSFLAPLCLTILKLYGNHTGLDKTA